MATGGFPESTSTGAGPKTERPLLTAFYDDCSDFLIGDFLIYRLLKNLKIVTRIRGSCPFLRIGHMNPAST